MTRKAFDATIALSLLDSHQEFPVDFDSAWRWLGYGRKSDAKESLLNKGFLLDIDLRIMPQSDNHASLTPQEKASQAKKERIDLTVDCFKTWAMMANTLQGKDHEGSSPATEPQTAHASRPTARP
jgi:anti-repressor protein